MDMHLRAVSGHLWPDVVVVSLLCMVVVCVWSVIGVGFMVRLNGRKVHTTSTTVNSTMHKHTHNTGDTGKKPVRNDEQGVEKSGWGVHTTHY